MAKNVKSEHKDENLQTELAKREVLRLNNQESNNLTRECISMALMYLMSEKAYDSISISELAKRAGVSRTAFYRNYATKDDVVREIGKQVIDKLSEIVGTVRTNEDVHDMFVEFFKQIKEQREKVELIIRGNISFNLLFPNGRILENVIPVKSKKDHYRLVAIDAALIGIVTEWITNGCDLTIKELVNVVELGVSI